ncbi:hypothetical protein CDL15_Pgr010866 [Punica granatum]|uniref:Uncharacterized protein n=1 Tax=Punica granatum TaxID=22663 RepID=A0A218W612_PUNGR|nr:hypothetical protein CDL15_Pgr010866 [Punica granatum]
MMRSSLIGCYFLLFVAGIFEHAMSSPSFSSSALVEERQPQRYVKSHSFNRKFKHYYRSKVLVEEAKGPDALVSTLKPEFSRGSGINDFDDLVYHTDYHGVSTHPPTPPNIMRTLKPEFSRGSGINDFDDLVYHTDYRGVGYTHLTRFDTINSLRSDRFRLRARGWTLASKVQSAVLESRFVRP